MSPVLQTAHNIKFLKMRYTSVIHFLHLSQVRRVRLLSMGFNTIYIICCISEYTYTRTFSYMHIIIAFNATVHSYFWIVSLLNYLAHFSSFNTYTTLKHLTFDELLQQNVLKKFQRRHFLVSFSVSFQEEICGIE